MAAMRGCSFVRKAGALKPRAEQQLFNGLNVEHRLGERFRAARGVPAIGKDQRRTLDLEHGETGIEGLAAIIGRRAAETHATAIRKRLTGSLSSPPENWR